MKDRKTRIREQISIYKSHSKSKALSEARDDQDKWVRLSNITAVVGPLLLTIIYAVKPFNTESLFCRRNTIDLFLAFLTVGAIFSVNHKVFFYFDVAKEIELSKEQQNIENEELIAENRFLDAYHSFSINAIRTLAERLQQDELNLSKCSDIIISCLYDSLLILFDNDYITINIYELCNNTVRMINTFTPLQYAEKHDTIENPLLYMNRHDGISIFDERIKEYYCIRILKGEISGIDKKYILPDWISILKEFKCDKLTNDKKQEIIKNKDRKACVNSGFLYNQYIGIEFFPKDEITGFLEIIPMKKARICSDDIDSIATEIKDSFVPLLNVMWTISANRKEDQQNGS